MPLERIWVERSTRQREDPDPGAGGLMASIALRGVLMPVILEEVPNDDGYHILYAGERRYAASLNLGLDDIPYRFARAPSQREIQIIEFEENAKRKDLTWQETCKAVVTLHALHVDESPDWTFEQTGVELGWRDGSLVSRYHFIHASWHDEAVRRCGTMNEAYNFLQRRQKRAQASKLEELLDTSSSQPADETEEEQQDVDDNNASVGDSSGLSDGGGLPRSSGGSGVAVDTRSAGRNITPTPRPSTPRPSTPTLPIIHANFLEWAPAYAGPRFNLIHCDFPYGISLGENAKNTGNNSLAREKEELYQDTPETYTALLDAFVTHFDRFAADSCHVMFWFSNRHEVEVMTRKALLSIPGFAFLRFPLIWHKSDNAGFMTPGTPRHIYETCLVGFRGDRPIVKYISDCYSGASDNSLHLSAKPEPMLKYFMGMVCDEHSTVLDPTCGSGSALRAADSLKASRVLGLEMNPEMVQNANKAFLQSRALRRVSDGVSK